MLDLDEFKHVNDNHGHKLGDKMLREVAAIVQSQLREYDFLARYAGDEFVALVQEVVGVQVEELCTRIESAVSQFSLPVGRNGTARVGISVGTATFGADGETLDQLLNAADDQMYRMKSTHRWPNLPAVPPNVSTSDPKTCRHHLNVRYVLSAVWRLVFLVGLEQIRATS
jgi:diguanylate cyclase (GGDEF)-like protein